MRIPHIQLIPPLVFTGVCVYLILNLVLSYIEFITCYISQSNKVVSLVSQDTCNLRLSGQTGEALAWQKS